MYVCLYVIVHDIVVLVVNCLYDLGSAMSSVGGSSDPLISSLPLSVKPSQTTATTSSYVPSRLDSALSSTYHPLLGSSPLPPMTSSSSAAAAPGSSLKMFLGQHQPGFPSSSIKVHSRTTGSVGSSAVGSGGSQSVGSKLGSSDWPDLGVTITSKSQWTTDKGVLVDSLSSPCANLLCGSESLSVLWSI